MSWRKKGSEVIDFVTSNGRGKAFPARGGACVSKSVEWACIGEVVPIFSAIARCVWPQINHFQDHHIPVKGKKSRDSQ